MPASEPAPPLTPQDALARLQAWLDLWKFLLGSVAVVLITAWLTHLIQQRELDLKKAEQEAHRAIEETKQLGEFLDKALVDSIDAQVRFAEYFKTLTRNQDSRVLWENYYQALLKHKRDAENLVAQVRETREQSEAPNLSPDQKQELEKKGSQLAIEAAAAVARLEPLNSSRPAVRLSVFAADDEQLRLARHLLTEANITSLEGGRITISRIRKLNDNTRPKEPEIAYFLAADATSATDLAHLAEDILGVARVLVTRKEDSSIKQPGYLELWIPTATLLPPQPTPAPAPHQ